MKSLCVSDAPTPATADSFPFGGPTPDIVHGFGTLSFDSLPVVSPISLVVCRTSFHPAK